MKTLENIFFVRLTQRKNTDSGVFLLNSVVQEPSTAQTVRVRTRVEWSGSLLTGHGGKYLRDRRISLHKRQPFDNSRAYLSIIFVLWQDMFLVSKTRFYSMANTLLSVKTKG